ncbi:uncharacterized protein LOC124814621 [Hydra vulgaris]|uniref:Uncharacterized protein LOC124814621 n=1 Tax=Hydra vulgaris TaxID=6087 RepID=A0ABM4BYU6_HYDVU
MRTVKKFFWKINSFVILISLLLILVGVVVDTWWIKYDNNETVKNGLWKECNQKNDTLVCKIRQNILMFKYEQNKDWIIILLTAVELFAALSLSTSLYISYGDNKKRRIAVFFILLFTLSNVLFSIAFISFTEVMFINELLVYNRGWCLYLTYLGSFMIGLAYLFTCMLVYWTYNVNKNKPYKTANNSCEDETLHESILLAGEETQKNEKRISQFATSFQ